MRFRVGGIRVLIGTARSWYFVGQPVRNVFVVFRRFMGDAAWADHDLGSIGAQQATLLFADLVGHDKDAVISFERGGQRQSVTGIAAGRLDDCTAWTQQASLLALLNQRRPDAVLDATTGVKHFHLRQHERRHISGDMTEMYQGRVAHKLEYILIITHAITCGFGRFVHYSLSLYLLSVLTASLPLVALTRSV